MTESNEPSLNARSTVQVHEQPTAHEFSSDREMDMAMIAAAGGIAAASAEIVRQVRAKIIRAEQLGHDSEDC